MKETIYQIEDDFHSDHHGEYSTYEEAFAELERVASVPWGQEPNICPCGNGNNCVRQYYLLEGIREKGSYMFEKSRILKWLTMSKEDTIWEEPKEN